jgi:hypothetical protein
VPLCVRVSRVSRECPGSPRCLFPGTQKQKFSKFTLKKVEAE